LSAAGEIWGGFRYGRAARFRRRQLGARNFDANERITWVHTGPSGDPRRSSMQAAWRARHVGAAEFLGEAKRDRL